MSDMELTVIPAASLPTIIKADTDDILGALARKVAAFRPDISTPAGRDEMRSLAYEIARSRTKLDNIGKSLGEDAKKTVDAINAERRVLRERLEELQAHVRDPLTAWENAEKDRVAGHEKALAEIVESSGYGVVETADELALRLNALHNYPARDWQEFAARARQTLDAEITRTAALHEAAVKREAEAAELARLRAEAAEREKKEREEQIAAEAADAARREAEAKARKEAEEVERKARAERDAAAQRERDAQAAVERAQRDAREAEARAKTAAEKAEADKIAAEARAKREREEAIEAERQRVVRLAEAKRLADVARAADVEHRGSINRDALAGFVGIGLTEELAQSVVIAIAKGAIPHITITY